MAKDNDEYWITRHENFFGDIRSVGNLSKDIQQNLHGYQIKINNLREVILNKAETLVGKNVLEIGCGIGMMAPDIAELGALYTGIDISPLALQQAKERYPLGDFICDNIINYQLDKKFDIVYCTDVLVHLISDENWFHAIANMKRHLNKQGFIVIKEIMPEERESPSPHVVSRSFSEYLEANINLNMSLEKSDLSSFYYMTPA